MLGQWKTKEPFARLEVKARAADEAVVGVERFLAGGMVDTELV